MEFICQSDVKIFYFTMSIFKQLRIYLQLENDTLIIKRQLTALELKNVSSRVNWGDLVVQICFQISNSNPRLHTNMDCECIVQGPMCSCLLWYSNAPRPSFQPIPYTEVNDDFTALDQRSNSSRTTHNIRTKIQGLKSVRRPSNDNEKWRIVCIVYINIVNIIIMCIIVQ